MALIRKRCSGAENRSRGPLLNPGVPLRPRRDAPCAADALRLYAQSLTHSKSALGAKYRRLRARLGTPKAIVAMAHHLARLVYRMLRYGQNYVEKGIHQYELKFRVQRIKWLNKEARSLNLQLVATQ